MNTRGNSIARYATATTKSAATDERKFAALYGREGRLTGVLSFNRPRDLIQCRRWIGERLGWDEALARAEATG